MQYQPESSDPHTRWGPNPRIDEPVRNDTLEHALDTAFTWCESRARETRTRVHRSCGRWMGISIHLMLLLPILTAKLIIWPILSMYRAIEERLVVIILTRNFLRSLARDGPRDVDPSPREFIKRTWKILRPPLYVTRLTIGFLIIWLCVSFRHVYTPHVWDPIIVEQECTPFLASTKQCGRFYGGYACIRAENGAPMVINQPLIAWNGSTTSELLEYVEECGLPLVRNRYKEVVVYNVTGVNRESIRLRMLPAFCIQHLLEARSGWKCPVHLNATTTQ